MEAMDVLRLAWGNLPIIAAIILLVLFGIACAMKKTVKAVLLFFSVVLTVFLGVV